MAAEITLFARAGTGDGVGPQVPSDPIASYTATFTPTNSGLVRVYANGSAVALTMNTFTWNVPSGTVEYFGVKAGVLVTVA